MKPVRSVVIAVVTLLCAMTIASVALFSRCRCRGKHFSVSLCLIRNWTPGVRADLPTCRENLITLELAKYDWASEYRANEGTEVTWDDLRICLERGKPPVCNQGGHYLLGLVGEEPDCLGACPLHANPFQHALEPAVFYASGDENPLSAARAVYLERWREREEPDTSDPPADDELQPPPQAD